MKRIALMIMTLLACVSLAYAEADVDTLTRAIDDGEIFAAYMDTTGDMLTVSLGDDMETVFLQMHYNSIDDTMKYKMSWRMYASAPWVTVPDSVFAGKKGSYVTTDTATYQEVTVVGDSIRTWIFDPALYDAVRFTVTGKTHTTSADTLAVYGKGR